MIEAAQRRSFLTALLMIIFLGLYIVITFWYAVVLIFGGDTVATIIGVLVLLFPILGVWAIYREVRFAVCGNRLIKMVTDEGDLPTDDLPLRPSGKAVRDAADPLIDVWVAKVEENDKNWRSWLKLGLVQDASGYRSVARKSILQAIRIERDQRKNSQDYQQNELD